MSKFTEDQLKRQFFADLHYYQRKPRYWKQDATRLGWKRSKLFISNEEILQDLEDHTCAVCQDGYEPDIRWLRISCFYDLSEVSAKLQYDEESKLYFLPFCKPCRGNFMFEVLGKWLESNGHKDDPHRNGESLIQYV